VSESMFDKYGGFRTFTEIVSVFYQKVLDSDELAPYFEGVNMENLMAHQTNFLAKALGGPDKYEGVDLKRAHSRFNIKESHFIEVAELLEESLDEAGVEDSDIATIISLIAGLKDEIISA